MIDAWDVYWVMQLDSIIGAAIAGSTAGCIGGLICLVASVFFESVERWYSEESQNKALISLASRSRWFIWPVWIFACVIALTTPFIPTSRTAAAMYVLPAIVNNEKVHQEIQEIYDLAKDGLKQLVKAEDE